MILLQFILAYRALSQQSAQESPEKFIMYSKNPSGEIEKFFVSRGSQPKMERFKFKLIDCVENKFYCEDQGISKFPAIKRHSKFGVEDYTWAFTTEDITEYLLKLSRHELPIITSISSFDSISSHQSGFIIFFNPEHMGIFDTSYMEHFRQIGSENKGSHVYFASCYNGDVALYANIKKEDMPIIINVGSDSAYTFNLVPPFTRENIREFVENYRCTLSLEVTYSYLKEALQCFKGKVVGLVFLNSALKSFKNDPDHFKMLMMDKRLAYDNRFQFGYVYTDKYPDLVHEFDASHAGGFIVYDYRLEKPASYNLGEFDLSKRKELEKVVHKVWDHEDLQEFVYAPPTPQCQEEPETINEGQCRIEL